LNRTIENDRINEHEEINILILEENYTINKLKEIFFMIIEEINILYLKR